MQVGSPGQSVRLIPATSASAGAATWVVISEGCSQANPNLTNCAEERGGLFLSNTSTSWTTEGLPNGPDGALFNLITYEESKLGFSGNAYYGFDTVTLGLTGSELPTLESQVIAGYATNDFWLGSLGLSPLPFNFTNLNDPLPSLMGTLRNQSIIPSSSWAYTAGASYLDPSVYGSLTLGGYDSQRITSGASNITVAFGADVSRDLLVTLDSISYDTVASSPLLASGVNIFINSLIVDMWLPITVCRAFEQAFSLSWDEDADMYLLDNDTHDALTAQSPRFTFTFSAPSGSETVDITLPYAAFNLEAAAPLVNSSTRYFPLKRAQNETQYTLGRAFLQAAYVIADYDRQEFQLMQASFPSSEDGSDLVAIHPPGHEKEELGSVDDPVSESDDGLGGGAIAGVVVGIVAGIVVGSGGAIWYFRRKRKGLSSNEVHSLDEVAEKRSGASPGEEATEVAGIGLAEKDGEGGVSEMDGKSRFHETDGKGVLSSELPSPHTPLAELQDEKSTRGRSELDAGNVLLPQELKGSEPDLVELDCSNIERK